MKVINNTNRPHVYIIRNTHNGMYYFGVHNGSKTSTYTGSSKQLNAEMVVFGKENFEKEILYTFNTIEEAYLMERAIVNQSEVLDPMCYNKQLGGFGGGRSCVGAVDYHKRCNVKHTTNIQKYNAYYPEYAQNPRYVQNRVNDYIYLNDYIYQQSLNSYQNSKKVNNNDWSGFLWTAVVLCILAYSSFAVVKDFNEYQKEKQTQHAKNLQKRKQRKSIFEKGRLTVKTKENSRTLSVLP